MYVMVFVGDHTLLTQEGQKPFKVAKKDKDGNWNVTRSVNSYDLVADVVVRYSPTPRQVADGDYTWEVHAWVEGEI